jgi:hypothetical protein
MPAPAGTRYPHDRFGVVAVLLVPVLVATGVIVLLAEWRAGHARLAGVNHRRELLDRPAVRHPPVVPAGEAGLADGAAVIGLSEGGRHRAYVLAGLAPVDRHVLNDTLGGRPVTVTYCDRTGRAAVFTGPPGGEPLDVAVGGWDGGTAAGCLLLRVGPVWYRQDTGAAVGGGPDGRFPYPRHAFVRTTWGEWRAAHPDTDVYLGPPSAARGARP